MNSGGDLSNHYPNLLKREDFDDLGEEFRSSGAPIQEAEPFVVPPNFPDDLIVEILLRLPARSLSRFKTVSRSWFSLILSPDFIKTHLAIVSRGDDYDHQGLVFTVRSQNLESQIKLCSLNSLVYPSTDANFTSTTIDSTNPASTPTRKSSFRVVGSCNGLVCISVANGKELILWNPCTKRVKRVHGYDSIGLSMKSHELDKRHVRYDTFGFGYDELNDDYKVVGMCIKLDSVLGRGRLPYVAGVRLYGIKYDFWRSIEVYKDVIPSGFFSGLLAGGNLHWVASCHGTSWFFLSFDLSSETYGEIEWPSSEKVRDDWSVGVLGGCLSLLYNFEDINVDVWVMKEYGVKDSWTKIFSVPRIDGPEEFVSPLPICLLRNGDILLVINSVLVLYSPRNNSFRWFREMNKVEDVSIFLESLVSPYLNEGERSQLQLNRLREK